MAKSQCTLENKGSKRGFCCDAMGEAILSSLKDLSVNRTSFLKFKELFSTNMNLMCIAKESLMPLKNLYFLACVVETHSEPSRY